MGIGFGLFLAWPSAVAYTPSEVAEGSGIAAAGLPGFGEFREFFSIALGSEPRTFAMETVSSRTSSHASNLPCLEIARISPARMTLLC